MTIIQAVNTKDNSKTVFFGKIPALAYKRYSILYERISSFLLETEAKGLAARIPGINEDYYLPFNVCVAEAFASALDKDSLMYGGFSMAQVRYYITERANELNCDKIGKHSINELIWRLDEEIVKGFGEMVDMLHPEYVNEGKEYPFITLAGDHTDSADPVLSVNSAVRLACGLPVDPEAMYMSFPVLKGTHISDPTQQKNLDAIIGYIAEHHGQSGGLSALFIAGTGQGKTHLITKVLARALGEACGCGVYIVAPTTPQMGQLKEKYNVDVIYGQGDINGAGQNPCIRGYVYECANRIPMTAEDITGLARGNIVIIDEAHEIESDRNFRKNGISEVVNMCKGILSAGGTVIAMTASAEKISSTMPYNSLMGYGFICHVFGVDSDASVNGKAYPYYTYDDATAYGKEAGVCITNAIPADRIRVCYPNNTDDSFGSSLVALATRELKAGKKLLVQHDNIDLLCQVRNVLSAQGYHAAVCSSLDKGTVFDQETGRRNYKNKTYDNIIKAETIDFTDIDIVLTTKLLENGTSIKDIVVKGLSAEELEKQKRNVVTIQAFKYNAKFDVEAFEQFSGRIRFPHDEAILLMPRPKHDRDNEAYGPNMDGYVQKGLKRVSDIAEKLKAGLISERRLRHIDFQGVEDAPEGIDKNSGLNAEAICYNTARAIKRYYKTAAYNEGLFKDVINERYEGKETVFEQLPSAAPSISRIRDMVTAEELKKITGGLERTLSEPEQRSALIKGETQFMAEDTRNVGSLSVRQSMYDAGCASLIKGGLTTLAVAGALQDIAGNGNVSLFVKSDESLPSSLAPEQVQKRFTDAVRCNTAREMNALQGDIMAEGFGWLSRYPKLSDVITRYAVRFGDRGGHDDEDEFIEEVKRAVGEDDKDGKLEALLRLLLLSERARRIFRVLYAFPYIKVNGLDFYENLFRYTDSDIDSYMLIQQFSGYALDRFAGKSSTLGKLLPTEATFDIVTGRKAFEAVFGDKYEYQGITSWQGKTLTKVRCEAIHSVYCREMMKLGMPYDANVGSGRLKIIKLFASAFSFKQIRRPGRTAKEGRVVIELKSPRRQRPMDMGLILGLNFSNISRSGRAVAEYDVSQDPYDDLPFADVENNPFGLAFVKIEKSFLSDIRKDFYRVLCLEDTGLPVAVYRSTGMGAAVFENSDPYEGFAFLDGYNLELLKGHKVSSGMILSSEIKDALVADPSPGRLRELFQKELFDSVTI